MEEELLSILEKCKRFVKETGAAVDTFPEPHKQVVATVIHKELGLLTEDIKACSGKDKETVLSHLDELTGRLGGISLVIDAAVTSNYFGRDVYARLDGQLGEIWNQVFDLMDVLDPPARMCR